MTEEIKYYKEKEYPLKWIPAEQLEETPQQTVARLEQENENAKATVEECHKYMAKLEDENEELREKFNFMETANDIKKLDIDSLRDTNNKLRSALEEIKKAIKSYDLIVDNGASVDTLYTIRKIINEVLE